jgi:hypothetical protein
LWKNFYPKGELQRGIEDYMDCVIRGHNNEIEKQLNYAVAHNLLSGATLKFLNENGYFDAEGKIVLSNRIPAIGSGTTRVGNSLKAPIHWVMKNGIHPRSLLSEEKKMTWSEYHNPANITAEMLAVGKESLRYLLINYLSVPRRDFDKFAGNIRYEIFDNYIDVVDGNYDKRLAADFNFYPNGYQLIINEIPQEEDKEKEDMPTFYQLGDSPKLYQKGVGSGKYHHILDEPTFRDLYGDFSQVKIVKIGEVVPEFIGMPVGQSSSFLQSISDLFNKLRGR